MNFWYLEICVVYHVRAPQTWKFLIELQCTYQIAHIKSCSSFHCIRYCDEIFNIIDLDLPLMPGVTVSQDNDHLQAGFSFSISCDTCQTCHTCHTCQTCHTIQCPAPWTNVAHLYTHGSDPSHPASFNVIKTLESWRHKDVHNGLFHCIGRKTQLEARSRNRDVKACLQEGREQLRPTGVPRGRPIQDSHI